jgi:hypothetical protein
MATSSSTPTIPASLAILVSEKLTRDNYQLWRAQVLLAICVAQLEGFIDGSARVPEKILEVEKDSKKMMVPNPDYAVWRDQHVLTYLVTSLSREVLAAVASNMTVVDMWVVISMIFASQSRSLILHLYNQFVATRKGELSVTSYFSSMCGYANEMAAAGKPLDNDDIVSYILNGLDADYNSLIE